MTPVDKTVIAYLSLITILILFSASRIDKWPWFLVAHLLGISFIVCLARISKGPRIRRHAALSITDRLLVFVHGWHPVASIPATYMELSYLIPRVHATDFDVQLSMLDHRLFGVHPTVWLERFTVPAVTEVLQLAYPMYYFLPIILGAVLWRKAWLDRFYFWVFVIAFGFYLSYLGYFLVPAIGPRYLPEIVQQQSAPLSGVWLYPSIRSVLDRAEGITRDCFPSGHTEMTLLVLYYAHRLHRRTFYTLLPVGIAIIVSTVYLRYHYVVDVIAGALLALVVVLSAESVYRALGGKYSLNTNGVRIRTES